MAVGAAATGGLSGAVVWAWDKPDGTMTAASIAPFTSVRHDLSRIIASITRFIALIARFIVHASVQSIAIHDSRATVATMQQIIDSSRLSRRHVLLGGMALAALPLATRAPAAIVSGVRVDPTLLDRARAAMARHAGSIVNRDRIALVDFSRPSREPRMTMLHLQSGQGMDFLVAHGRGSDPDHSGWLNSFSNEPGSLATSRGTYVTTARYIGVHGDAQRMIGLDPENSNAEPRAIVIHGADYVSEDLIQSQGKLGRSEGCFAVRRDDIGMVLALLGEGTMIYADRL
jgi:hypothetical protein